MPVNLRTDWHSELQADMALTELRIRGLGVRIPSRRPFPHFSLSRVFYCIKAVTPRPGARFSNSLAPETDAVGTNL